MRIAHRPSSPTSSPMPLPRQALGLAQRPAARHEFEIAIICTFRFEAAAVHALFGYCWDDDGSPYGKAAGDPNVYSTGAISYHNVVVVYMPGIEKANTAAVAANCLASFPNLAVVLGVCSAVPFGPNGSEIVLGDVIVSDCVIEYDCGLQLPDHFIRKSVLLDAWGCTNTDCADRSRFGHAKSATPVDMSFIHWWCFSGGVVDWWRSKAMPWAK